MAKDKSTSNAEPMTHVVEFRPRLRYQMQVEAHEAAAAEATKATPKKKEG